MTMPQTRHYEMKDSGVEWIGRMPIGWKIVPAKFFMKVQAGYPFDSERFDNSQGIPLIRIRDITSGHTETFYNGDYPEEYVVHNNDLLVGMDGDFNVRWWQGGEAVLNQRCCRIFARNGLLLRYFYFLLPFYLKQVNELAYSTTVKHLANGDIGNADICLPPEDEQTAIAAYLDKKCATIDAIIAEAKASIEEYKSWKASVIFETVTKGLNPNAEMKDSGVEWIGEIPKGWKVSAVKRHYSITLGKMLESVPQSNDATLENYMCASNIKWGGIDTTTNRQMWFSPIEKEEYLLKEGDLLVMEGGSAGTSAIYRGEYAPCYMQNSVNRCCSKDGSLTHFLYYWMFLVYHSGHVESACNRATIMHLTKEKLGRLPFVYAPKEEQASIVSYLDRKCSLIDGIILEKEDLIRELENYKRSLIFEVVTGKRRVC